MRVFIDYGPLPSTGSSKGSDLPLLNNCPSYPLHPPQSFTKASVKHENVEDEVMVQNGEKVSYSSFDVLELLGERSFVEEFKVLKKNSGKVMAMKLLSKKSLRRVLELRTARRQGSH